MALPLSLAGFFGGAQVLMHQSTMHGPFKSSAGNYYILGRSSTSTSNFRIIKASDPSSSFSSISDTVPDGIICDISTYQVSDVIHIVISISGSTIISATFDMSTDTLSAWATVATNAAPTANEMHVGIVVRSDGSKVVGYNGEADSIMGSGLGRIWYNIWTSGGGWGTATKLTAADLNEERYFCGIALGSSDRVHFLNNIYLSSDASSGLAVSTLNSSNVVQTDSNSLTVSFTWDNNWLNGKGPAPKLAISYSETNQRICWVIDDQDVKLISIYFDSADSPTITQATINNASSADAQPVAFNDTGDSNKIWCWYVLASDGDVYATYSTDHGVTWSTPTNILTAAQNTTGPVWQGPGYPPSTPYDRGGNYILPMLYHDGTDWYYNEYNIRSSGGGGRRRFVIAT